MQEKEDMLGNLTCNESEDPSVFYPLKEYNYIAQLADPEYRDGQIYHDNHTREIMDWMN